MERSNQAQEGHNRMRVAVGPKAQVLLDLNDTRPNCQRVCLTIFDEP